MIGGLEGESGGGAEGGSTGAVVMEGIESGMDITGSGGGGGGGGVASTLDGKWGKLRNDVDSVGEYEG